MTSFVLIFKFIHSLKYYFYRPSRISIALSLARVFPVFHTARRSAFFLAVICILSYLTCVFILTFECPSQLEAPWYETIATHCHNTGTTFVVREVGSACELFFPPPHISLLSSSLSVDLSVDGIFILFPIITLWKVKLPQNLRRIIVSAFSGSALTLITAIIFCIIGYNATGNLNLGPDPDIIVRLASHLEVRLSLLYKVYIYQSSQFSGSCFFDGRQSFGSSVVLLSYLQTDS